MQRDPFSLGVLFEKSRAVGDWRVFNRRVGVSSHNFIELASDYAAAGRHNRAIEVLAHYANLVGQQVDTPLVYYYLADFHDQVGETLVAKNFTAIGTDASAWIFSNRREDLVVLQSTVARSPSDYRAWCDIGNLLYSKRRYEDGIAAWERARDLAADFPQPRRNLGLAYFNQRGDADAAWNSLNEAYRLNPDDARVLYELDRLAKRLNHDPEERLERLAASVLRARARRSCH